MKPEHSKWILAGWAVTLLAAGMYIGYQRTEYAALQDEYSETIRLLGEHTVKFDLMLDYGNGSRVWYNGTVVPVGCRLLNATILVADPKYLESDFGVFVTSINGVGGNEGRFWVWNNYRDGWEMGEVGAGAYVIREGDVLSWVYGSF